MSKPIIGKPYTIVKDDTLSGIAYMAYGNGQRWREIWAANKNNLRSGKKDLIFPGEVLNIPRIPELEPLTGTDVLADSGPDEIAIVVEGEKIKFEAGRVIRTLDTPADGFAAKMMWSPADPNLGKYTELFRAYACPEAKAYVGGRLKVTGHVYITKPQGSPNGQSMTINGFSKTVDMVDSAIGAKKEFKNLTLAKIADELIAKTYGLEVNFSAGATAKDGVFDRVKAGMTEKNGAFFAKLCKQRAILFSSDIRGNPFFLTAENTGDPVDSLGDSLFKTREQSAVFDCRKRFHTYKAIVQRRGAAKKTAVSIDKAVRRTRMTAFSADETTAGNLQTAADWERAKALGAALTMPITVDNWYDSQNRLWEENTFVTVVSSTLSLPNGYTFLIRGVEYVIEANKRHTILSLVPPSVLSGGKLEDPWA